MVLKTAKKRVHCQTMGYGKQHWVDHIVGLNVVYQSTVYVHVEACGEPGFYNVLKLRNQHESV